MKINLRVSSIPLMIGFLENLKAGTASKGQVSSVLNHEDYDFELRRYNVKSRDAIIFYFENIAGIDEKDIPALSEERPFGLRNKHDQWIQAFENPQYYRQLYENVMVFLMEEKLDWAYARVRRGVPADVEIETIDIISTMSIGPSFGYVFDKALHFDLMGIGEYCQLQSLPSIISHELHHIAMLGYASGFMDTFSPEERYIFNFSGEGLAVKFCNNAQGCISKPLYAGEPVNEGLDPFSMGYLNAHFHESLAVFIKTIKGIRNGTMTEKEIAEQAENYWWNPYLEHQEKSEIPKLQQSRIYGFGNDFYGTIYDIFGIESLFDCIRHPLKALDYFKEALAILGIDSGDSFARL